MAETKTFLRALRERLMYLIAVLLILLIPLIFFSFGSANRTPPMVLSAI